ncbi:MAG: DUF2799 domain-containing protein [Pseudobdellovibrionaceae bacterium]
MRIRAFVVLCLTFLLSSCASYFTRKDCEKMNWYQIGYDAALRGDRISNDETVNKCRKVEAEISESQLDVGFKAGMSRYCQADGVFQTGKNGDLFNTDFCEPGQLSFLRKRHQDGLNSFCTDGMTAGLSGKKYKNVCSPGQEKAFLPEYRKGRKKYLQGMIGNTESKVREANLELDKLSYEKRITDGRLAVLPVVKTGDQDPYANERSRLSSSSSSLSSSIYYKNQEKQKWEKDLDTFKQELVTLD